VFLLLHDQRGWRSSDKFVSQQQQNVLVKRGNFLQIDNFHCFDPEKTVSVTLSVLEYQGTKITSLLKELASITRAQLQLLKNVVNLDKRCQIVEAGHHVVNVGDKVLYDPPRNPGHVLSQVRYVGCVPEMAPNGHLLGLEVIEPGWFQGRDGRQYFDCDTGRGVFCDIGCVTPVSGNVGKITSMMEQNNNFDVWNQPVLNITLSERNNQAGPTLQQPSNSLRMIHNDLRGLFLQTTESESENKESFKPRISPENITRPSVSGVSVHSGGSRTRKDSDQFSWDPNSKRSNSKSTSAKKNSNGSIRSEGDAWTRDVFDQRGCSPPSSNSSSSLVLKHGNNFYNPSDYSDARNEGGDYSDRDTPIRDSFLTPVTNEENLTWSQRLSSSVSRQPQSSSSPRQDQILVDIGDQIQRPEPSPSPPVQFVEIFSHESEQIVAVGSMVQLETEAGDKMCGVVRYCGDYPQRPGHWVGVELEDEVRGGSNGWTQNGQLFTCAPGKGVFVPYTHVIPDPRFKESLPPPVLGQDFGPVDSPIVSGFCPPHSTVESVSSICGRNKGIQGHQNSCYLDATLFAMFSFTSVFDSLLYRPRGPGDISRYDEVQQCLKEEIVNPLRKGLFVRADKVMRLRTMLDNLSDVKGLMDQEKDPEEFLSSLLTQVMKVEPFLELSSGQTAHHYQILVDKDPNISVPTVQDLFDQSFGTSSCRVKLKRAPSVLILQMPRFGRQFKLYDRILPSELLDVTDVIMSTPRQCVICGVLAEYECPACYGSHLSGLASTAYCSACLQRTHQHKQRRGHKQEKLERPPGWTKQLQQPIPRIYMELVAVVCIETSHYVSFVRCGDTPQAPWCFFDSMADRKGEQNGYNIPELTPASDIEKLMSETFAEELKGNPKMQLGEQAKRLVSDVYMCIYQSPDVKMYR